MSQFTKYYRMQTRREQHINPFELRNLNPYNSDKYNKIPSYPRKEYFNKLKYKYPSLEKYEYNIPVNFSINLKSPIYEEINFYKKKNLNLSVSMKNIAINKDNINNKYQRITPSFTIPNKNKILEQLKEEYKNEVKRLENNYNVFRKEIKQKGQDTTEKFFTSISKNILKNYKIHVRNVRNDININKLENSSFFLTDEQNHNFNFRIINYDKNQIQDINKDNISYSNGRDILSARSYRLNKKNLNLVDPNVDKGYMDIIKTERAVKTILTSPNY